MAPLGERLRAALAPDARDFFDGALARAGSGGPLESLLPALSRRLGKDLLGGGRQRIGSAEVDLDAWRLCDAGAALVLEAAGAWPQQVARLYDQGDLDERTLLLRTMALWPPEAVTATLLRAVQRSNVGAHFETAVLDSDLVVRTLVAGVGFGAEEGRRILLKMAFLGLSLARLRGGETLADPELSRMLQDFAREREAAGRPVWPDTLRLIARAPVAGTRARLLGALEHGDVSLRRAAVEGLLHLGDERLAAFLGERSRREDDPELSQRLASALGPEGPGEGH